MAKAKKVNLKKSKEKSKNVRHLKNSKEEIKPKKNPNFTRLASLIFKLPVIKSNSMSCNPPPSL